MGKVVGREPYNRLEGRRETQEILRQLEEEELPDETENLPAEESGDYETQLQEHFELRD